jgi:hypothetical protein
VDHDKTVELVKNLDRPAIEEKLRQIVAEAKARKLDNIPPCSVIRGLSQGRAEQARHPAPPGPVRAADHKALFN